MEDNNQKKKTNHIWKIIGMALALIIIGHILYVYVKPHIPSFIGESSLQQYQPDIARCLSEKQKEPSGTKVLGLEFDCAIEVAASFYSTSPEKALQLCMAYNPLLTTQRGLKSSDAAVKADEALARATCKSLIEKQIQGTVVENPQNRVKEFAISEAGVKIEFPQDYTLIKNTEKNRRGSFVSYDFMKKGNFPLFQEIQFFSKESIENFTKNCTDEPCFFGDYPGLERYTGQKDAFAANTDYAQYKLKKFGDRYYFTSNFKCEGDSCVIREYTTFIGSTKVDIWVTMDSESQGVAADKLFKSFKISE